MSRIPPIPTLVNLQIWGEILEHAIYEAQHHTCNESLTLKTLNFAYKLWNTLYSRCIGTLWPNHFDFNLQTSGGIHAARDIWNADVYSQVVFPVTPYFWQTAVNSTDIPVAQVVLVTERSRNRSHVCSCDSSKAAFVKKLLWRKPWPTAPPTAWYFRTVGRATINVMLYDMKACEKTFLQPAESSLPFEHNGLI